MRKQQFPRLLDKSTSQEGRTYAICETHKDFVTWLLVDGKYPEFGHYYRKRNYASRGEALAAATEDYFKRLKN